MATIYKDKFGITAFNSEDKLVMLASRPMVSWGFSLERLEESLTTLEEIMNIVPPCHRYSLETLYFSLKSAHHKLEQRGRHFLVRTNDISDIEEVADWARSWLIEPDGRLDKARRQAFQTMVERAGRHVHLSPLGPCHFIATGWKQKPAPQPYKQR